MFWQTSYPSPILLNLNFIQIYWYGFLITLATLSGFFVFNFLAKKSALGGKKEENLNLFFYLIIFGIIGARLYHCLSEFNYYWHNPLKIFYLWQGGLGIYGAILAGAIVLFIFLFKNKSSTYLPMGELFSFSKENNPKGDTLHITHYTLFLDLLAPALALGQAIGRWGNYFNQELYGPPTNSFLGIAIAPQNRLPGFENFTFFQPLFFYESLFCLIIALIMVVILTSPSRDEEGSRLSRKIPGTIFLLFLFLYSSWRFIIEFFRIDPQPIFLHLRLGQWVSAIFIILSLVFYILLKKWYNNSCHPSL